MKYRSIVIGLLSAYLLSGCAGRGNVQTINVEYVPVPTASTVSYDKATGTSAYKKRLANLDRNLRVMEHKTFDSNQEHRLTNIAVAERDFSVCRNIGITTNCFEKVAKVRKNIDDCYGLIDNGTSAEYDSFFGKDEVFNRCVSGVAAGKKDSKICEIIPDSDERSFCEKGVGISRL